MNKLYETIKNIYHNLRGNTSRRAISETQTISPSLIGPSELYSEKELLELGSGAPSVEDMNRLFSELEEEVEE